MIVTADGSRTLFSPRYRQSFRSRHGALTEARHVFLQGSGVAARLAAGEPTSVLEVGFGAGLNALLTVDAAAAAGTRLGYVALDRALPPAGTLEALAYREALRDPALADALAAWLRSLPEPPPAGAELELGGARLALGLGDALAASLPTGVHAVYHDAFSPAANPEPWSAPFLTRLFDALAPDGTLVSYTVQGALRRRLRTVGFHVAKVPGPPGGKREALLARKPGAAGAAR